MILSHANQIECSKTGVHCFEGNGVAFFWVTMTGGAADPEEHLP